MPTELLTTGVPVPLSELRAREWIWLTLGVFWRLIAWSLASTLAGTLVTYAAAYGVSAAVNRSRAFEEYNRVVVPFTLLVGLVVSLVMTRWFVRLVLTGRYGALRLAVVRDDAGAAIATRPA
jgi:hypothetical protein